MKFKTKISLIAMCLCMLCIACVFSVAFMLTAIADSASDLAAARASENENLLARTSTAAGGDYRSGYNDSIVYAEGKITVTRPDGTDARVGTLLTNSALAKDEVLVNGEIAATSDLSAYYAADMTFSGYDNEWSTYGLTVARTFNGDGTTYHAITLEQGRGYIHYYTYTDSPVNESDNVPSLTVISAAQQADTAVKMEIVKTGNDFAVYVNGEHCVTQTIPNASPAFGTMMFDTSVVYENMVFKYLGENVDVDAAITVPEKLQAAREAQGTFATGLGETTMTSNLRSAETAVTYSNGAIVSDIPCTGDWANSANMLTDGYLSQTTVKNAAGENVATSALGALVSANVTYTGNVLEYRKIGVLFGQKAEGDATRYYALVYEPGRGYALIYSFLREADGSVSNEREPAVYWASNLGFAADKSLKFEIIVENTGISAYINNIEVANGISAAGEAAESVDLTGITPVVGAMFREIKGTVSNMTLKYLQHVTFEIPVEPIDAELESARANGTLLTDEDLKMSGNIRRSDIAMITYENGVGNAVKYADGRDVRMFNNANLRQNEAYVNDELVSTATLSVYYKAELTYKDRDSEYGNFGILIGRNAVNGNTRYYTLMLEPLRGFMFIYWFDVAANGATVSEGNFDVIVDQGSSIGIEANEKGTLEVIKNGNELNVYWNGKTVVKDFTNAGFENVIPLFGLSSYAVGGTYENLAMKVLTENYETYIPDTRPAYTTANRLENVTEIEDATAGENGFTFANGSEYCPMVEGEREYVYIQNEGVYTRVDGSELTAYVQATLTFGAFASPQQNWYGAGIVFRGQGENRYAVRFMGSTAVLMHYGTEMTSVGIDEIEEGSEILVQILSAPDSVTVWVNGTAIFEDMQLENAYKCTFGVWSVYNALTVSDLSMQYSVEVYDENPNASDDATLAYIHLDGALLEGFAAEKTEYTFELAKGSQVPVASQFKVATNHPYASAAIEKQGDVIVITIMAEDGTEKIYKITYLLERNTDSTLKSLTVDGEEIALTAGVIEYAHTMGAHKHMPVAGAVEAVTNDALASAEVTVEGSTITITVTAEDGSTTVYTVNITLNLSSNTNLSSISVKGEKLADFAADKFEYTYEYTDTVSEADIEFTCEDEYASASYELVGGKATITVTAEDGSTATYTITLTERTASSGTGGCSSSMVLGGSCIGIAACGMAAVLLKKKKEN